MSRKSKDSDNAERVDRCGLFGWEPDFLQRWKNMKLFMVCYVLLCLIYGMTSSYSSSMIPSIEKRFGFSSRTVGLIFSMNDISHVATALVTAHFGGRGHRPRWIMCGCMMLGVALLLHALPELLFPLKKLDSRKNVMLAQGMDNLCLENQTNPLLIGNQSAQAPVVTTETSTSIGPIAVFVLAQLLQGVGSTALIILGWPFIDDNVPKKDSPLYFGISFSSRIFGPVIGYAFGALCNSIFLDWTVPGFQQTDPRWISAWYLGYLFIGGGLCLFALTIGCFPATVQSSRVNPYDQSTKTDKKETEFQTNNTLGLGTSWNELPRDIKRLVTNGAFVCRACTTTLDGLFISGYFSFLPKFLGQQFQISPSGAALAGGVPNILAKALAIVIGGAIMRRWSFKPRELGMFLTAGGIIMSSGLFGVIGFGCPQTEIVGLPGSSQTTDRFGTGMYATSMCQRNISCQCRSDEFIPVCDTQNQKTFYSPCTAGCGRSGISKTNAKEKVYGNCSCAETSISSGSSSFNKSSSFTNGTVVNGLCPKTCHSLYYFVALLTGAMFFAGLPLSGGIMLQFRIVDVDLKNMANGISALLMSGLGYLPGPVIVGAIVDSTCKFWQVGQNGERRHCILYDTDAFRWKFHLFIGSVRTLSMLMDLALTCKIWNMQTDRDSEDRTTKDSDSGDSEAEPRGSTSLVNFDPASNDNGRSAVVVEPSKPDGSGRNGTEI